MEREDTPKLTFELEFEYSTFKRQRKFGLRLKYYFDRGIYWLFAAKLNTENLEALSYFAVESENRVKTAWSWL